MDRFVCIHGHFYQPPRENPWLETVEIQDSAAPYHDWNDRITAECYAPNGASRITDRENKIIRIMNNYGRMSFNFGPTLLSWLADFAHRAYRMILDADRISAERHNATVRPSRRSTTTSSCRWPLSVTHSPRFAGASSISSFASAGRRKVCGWRRPPSVAMCWT